MRSGSLIASPAESGLAPPEGMRSATSEDRNAACCVSQVKTSKERDKNKVIMTIMMCIRRKKFLSLSERYVVNGRFISNVWYEPLRSMYEAFLFRRGGCNKVLSLVVFPKVCRECYPSTVSRRVFPLLL